MQLAVFDIDGTLIGGTGTERRFFWFLLLRRRIRPGQLLAWLGFVLRYVGSSGANVFRRNKAYLAGCSSTVVEQWAKEFVARLPPDAWVPSAVARLRRHQEAGDHVVLLSGTLQPIAKEIARILAVDEVVATQASLADGRYTANPPVRHPFASSKVTAVGGIAARLGIGRDGVVAYGDSIHDLELFRAVGHPVLVRPDHRLLRLAGAEGWEVLVRRTAWWQSLMNYPRLWTGAPSIRQNSR
jgi:HAD superfamily hydrolase (TIGR01490 family)